MFFLGMMMLNIMYLLLGVSGGINERYYLDVLEEFVDMQVVMYYGIFICFVRLEYSYMFVILSNQRILLYSINSLVKNMVKVNYLYDRFFFSMKCQFFLGYVLFIIFLYYIKLIIMSQFINRLLFYVMMEL